MARPRKHLDALDLIAKREQRTPGSLYRLPKLQGAVMDVLAVSELDKAAVSATAIISTPNPDRSEDVVRQLGISLANYKKNPVVYYDHGFAHIQTPIGKSEDPDGKLTVKLKESGSQATCFFSQRMWEAMQIYELIDEGIVRCASIHIIPTVAKNRTNDSRFRSGLDIESSELLEWSWVGIPDNPEAVRKVLDRGKLAERNIPEALVKSLAKYAANPKGLVQGMSLKDDDMGWGAPAIARELERSIDLQAVAKALPTKKDDEEAGDKKKPTGDKPEGPPDAEASDEGEGEETPEAPQDGGDAEASGEPPAVGDEQAAQQPQQPQDFTQKPGAQLASGIHSAVTGFTQELTQQLAKQENEAIQSMANDVIDGLNAIAERCADGYRQAYGQDIPAAGGMQQPQQPVDQQEQQMMKRFIDRLTKDAGTPSPKKTEYGIRAIAKGLSDLSMKKSLSPEEVHRLGHWSKRIFELVDEGREQVAKSLQEVPPVVETPKSAEQPNPALLKAMQERNEIVKQITSLRTSLAN